LAFYEYILFNPYLWYIFNALTDFKQVIFVNHQSERDKAWLSDVYLQLWQLALDCIVLQMYHLSGERLASMLEMARSEGSQIGSYQSQQLLGGLVVNY
jgi:hypothetical protein